MKNHSASWRGRQAPQFINPHRLFHGVWLSEWLEERPEVSEKAKKLYAYLTYFAGEFVLCEGFAFRPFQRGRLVASGVCGRFRRHDR